MSFRFIPSNTTILAPFPYGDRHVQGSAKAQRVPAMIAQPDLDNISWPVYSSCASTVTNEAVEDAFMLNTLIDPCINEY